MPTQTAGTAKPKRGREPSAVPDANGQYMHIAAKISKMSGPEFLASLQRAGITTAKGMLQAKYKKK